MVRHEVQEAVPAGTITVSPSAAEAMALLTSASEGLAALIILACAALEGAKSSAAKTELRIAWFARASGFSLVHSNEKENKPDRIYGFESCFRPVVQYYCREEAQSTSPPFKIPKKLEAYFPECRNKQANEKEHPD